MQGEIPTPFVNRLPLRVGLYLEPALVQYVFEEKIQDHGDWRVEVGPMQTKLFRQVASAMFLEAVPVDSVTSPGANLDAVLAPSIVEFQISIPSQTRSEFYEVWIKYMMRLYDTHGTLIAEWPLTAYGKANRGDFGFMESSDSTSNSPGNDDGAARCRRVSRVALRDGSGSPRLVELAHRPPRRSTGGPT